MINAKKLIREVEKRPCLWLISCDEYNQRDKKDKAWDEIGDMLHRNWSELESSRKKMVVADLKRKWSNLRDYYRKYFQYLKEMQSSGKKPKKYIYGDSLTFLHRIFDIVSEDSCDDGGNNYYDTHLVGDLVGKFEDTESNNESNELPTPPVVKQRKRSTHERFSVKREILEIMKNRQVSQLRPEDPDAMFLMSFLPDIKEMSTLQKFDFKAGVIDLMKKIKFSQNSSTASPSYSNNQIATSSATPALNIQYATTLASNFTSNENKAGYF